MAANAPSRFHHSSQRAMSTDYAEHTTSSKFSLYAAYLLVPRLLVKLAKTRLESKDAISKAEKIQPADDGEHFLLPIQTENPQLVAEVQDAHVTKENILKSLGLSEHAAEIKLISGDGATPFLLSRASQTDGRKANSASRNISLLHVAIQKWLEGLPSRPSTSEKLHKLSRLSYNVYQPMLLLTPSFFSLFSEGSFHECFDLHAHALYETLCKVLDVTHIAVSGSIPMTSMATAHGDGEANNATARVNVLRSPCNFTPLFGDFGPPLPSHHTPSSLELEQAFWCSARQNGIYQTWAPRYTMFSRGNVVEKARILKLDSLGRERLGGAVEESSAVDLYAGIGYFAFSYAKAGVGKVLCWEINSWSVEGLLKGAQSNHWTAKLCLHDQVLHDSVFERHKIVVFQESNEFAPSRVQQVRSLVPPIRHVNCGYLPSSEASWSTALAVLDPDLGGWIHAHENVAIKEIDARKKEIEGWMRVRLATARGSSEASRWRVTCEHVERVKSYAPGLYHCVFDMAIFPTRSQEVLVKG